MLNQRTTQISLLGAGLCVLLMGAALPLARWAGFGPLPQKLLNQTETAESNSIVRTLALLPPQARAAQLEAIAAGEKSLDSARARYLLASDLIQQNQIEPALKWLENLEQEYPVLGSYIWLKRAQAYGLSGDNAKAQNAWQELVQRYPNDPATAEALYALGKSNPEYWEQAIALFPSHPRTIELISERLKANPNQLPLLLIVAKYGLYLENYGDFLAKLENQYRTQLTPQDWEAIAFGYWEKQEYGRAGSAYAKATPTPFNAYRSGRGLQLDGQREAARDAYKRLVTEFPEAKESGIGFIRLSQLVKNKEAIPYLDQAIAQFPNQAPQALLERAKVLESLGSVQSGMQARQSILSQHSNSDTAAELRWQAAKKSAASGDLRQAWQWAQQITTENPNSELAPQAAFWVGKWAARLGRQQEAQQAFEHTLANYPESYYAWRSAVFLGWNVGDFTTVRPLSPHVEHAAYRELPPAGSETLKELYVLGQDVDSWTRWQVEFQNRIQPTVAEQFTDGLMRLGVGDNLDGIFMVSSLSWREDPEERSQYQALKKTPAYGQALYPFPYLETIVKWSQERQINPVLVTALIRQESRFMPKIRSVVNATGLMQVMPETASWIAPKINLKQYNLENPDDNIRMGTWFLDYTHEEYNDNSMLAVASYNAGPGNVADWLKRFGFTDPDEFVEKIPFPETRGYVEHVFENYWNYLRLYNPEINQKLVQHRGSK